MMAGWNVLLPALASLVAGSPLEVTSPAGIDILYLQSYGVDISKCTELNFRMKACEDGHVLLGDGTATGSYDIIIGGWGNTQSGLKQCSLGCSSRDRLLFDTVGILNCGEYRNFWVSWGNGRIAFGTGSTPHADVIFNEAKVLIHDVYVLGYLGNANTAATIKLGDDNRSLFGLFGKDIAVIDTDDTRLSFVQCKDVQACTQLCHEHALCGRFAYNRVQNKCELHRRMQSFESIVPLVGWESWKMKYCTP